jgi:hypothetical protein
MILDLVFSFAKMRSHVHLDVTVKAGSMPETMVLADTYVLWFASLCVFKEGKQ